MRRVINGLIAPAPLLLFFYVSSLFPGKDNYIDGFPPETSEDVRVLIIAILCYYVANVVIGAIVGLVLRAAVGKFNAIAFSLLCGIVASSLFAGLAIYDHQSPFDWSRLVIFFAGVGNAALYCILARISPRSPPNPGLLVKFGSWLSRTGRGGA